MTQDSNSTSNLPSLPLTQHPHLNLTCPASVGSGESLTEILLSTTLAAENRTQEAKLLFGTIAKTLDEAKASSDLPIHLVNPFREFIADLNIVARKHFERHVKGISCPPPPYVNTNERKTTGLNDIRKNINPSVVLPIIKKSTFAAVTEAPPPKIQHPIPAIPKNCIIPTKPLSKKAEDYRLFVRVSEGYPVQKLSPYTVMLDLNTFLKENLIREIQTIKTVL